MPVFSLPSPWGIGTLGQAARDFVDFLHRAGQSCWQVLPMGPTSYGDSPYQSFSSFAGNPYFIDLDDLAAEGLLEREEYADIPWSESPGRVDYAALHAHRFDVLRLACSRLQKTDLEAQARSFLEAEADWLPDYALFMALKDRYGGKAWQEWPEPLRLRERKALAKARKELQEETDFWARVQYLFFRQWTALKQYAKERGISIIGDLPIYVAMDSADTWANPKQFQLEDGRPVEVSGCPPDAFSEDGQLWGNPLFAWDSMKKDHYRWWMKRIDFQFRLYDTLRIDHFRGFEAYYAIPAADDTARNGRWRPGPGYGFFREMEKQLGARDIIAEDLGYLTEGVHELLRQTGFPGMKVLEFAFGAGMEDSSYQPHRYPAHCGAYAGTHDNDTVLGWLNTCSRGERNHAKRYMRLNRNEGWNWGVMRTLWASPAELAVVQMQDLLGLGSEGRINLPSTVGANWQWRASADALTEKLARKVRADMRLYQRFPKA